MSTAIIGPSTTRPGEATPAVVAQIVAALRGDRETPDLRDAGCRGLSRMFEERRPGESEHTWIRRSALARDVCLRECPVLARCRRWEADNPGVPGVLAGRIPGAPFGLGRTGEPEDADPEDRPDRQKS